MLNIEVKYLPKPWAETTNGHFWTQKAEEKANRYKELFSSLSCPLHPNFPNRIIVVPRMDGVVSDRNFCCETFEVEEWRLEKMYNL